MSSRCRGTLLSILLALPLSAGAGPAAFTGRQLQPLPAPPGVAGAFAGVVGGRLVVAGGANFPDRPPWEGGAKVWTDRIWLLPGPGEAWRTAGHLPRANAYGASIQLPQGLLCVGGGNAERCFAEAFLICSGPFGLCFDEWPALPEPCANACGTRLGDRIFVIGGIASPTATVAAAGGWVLSLTNRLAGWTRLPPIPGPGRQLATAGVLGDSLLVVGGTALAAGPDGKPLRSYLADAWALSATGGWRQLASLPYPLAASPSPAATDAKGRPVLFGGDDAPSPDPARHAGFRSEMLAYDAQQNAWIDAGWVPAPRVTTPCVSWRGGFVVPTGEARRGIRSCEVWMYSAPMTEHQ